MGIQAVDEMQITVANAGRGGADQDFMVARVVDIDLFDRQGLMGTTKNCSLHFFSPTLACAATALSRLCLLEFARERFGPYRPDNMRIAYYLSGQTSAQLHSNIRTVRATSPAFIARKASLTSSSLPRRLIMSSRLRRPCK